MVSDSPYQVDEPVLASGTGAAVGFMGAMAMLLVVFVLQPLSRVSLSDLLARIGTVILPYSISSDPRRALLAGSVLHGLTGALLGLLFATSLRRIPVYGMVGVGTLYGIVIWVVANLLVSLFWRRTLWAMVHSFPWFVACVGYGLCLAGCAAWADSHRPAGPAVVLPRD